MPQFSYKGRSAGGRLVGGVMEANDSKQVAEFLINAGIIPVDIQVGRPSLVSGNFFKKRASPISLMDILLFSRQMYTLLKAGVPIMQALAGIEETTENPGFVRIVRGIRESLDAGRELSQALAQYPRVFSPLYVSMVQVGEATGMLESIFLRLAFYIDFEMRTRSQVKAALRYPVFVLLTMFVALAIVNLFVIPAFAHIYLNFHAQLPLLTRILISVSHFTVQFWPVLLGIGVGLFWLVRSWTRTVSGHLQWDHLKLRLPVAGKIVHRACLARFARSLALSMQSGMPIVAAMGLIAKVVDNDYLSLKIELMRDAVARGESILQTARSSGVFTPMVIQMIAVGEESGAIDELMQEVAELYEREVKYDLETLNAQIEPILIIVLGVLVLVVALGVFLPIWDLTRAAFGGH